MTIKLLGLRALTPMHAGTGSGEGMVDLPIIREKSTGLPIIPGSTIKGVLRSGAAASINAAFGDIKVAGSINFSDAYLLLLPVRSMAGIFAWVTSPYILRRFVRDLQFTAIQAVGNQPLATLADIQAITPNNTTTAMHAQGSELLLSQQAGNQTTRRIVLEDIQLTTVQSLPNNSAIINSLSMLGVMSQQELNSHLCIVSDTVMSFLLQTATEIRGRNRIDQVTGVVANQALWYEEMLPVESVMAGIVRIVPRHRNVTEQTIINELVNQMQHLIMLGGKSSVGRGVCSARLI